MKRQLSFLLTFLLLMGLLSACSPKSPDSESDSSGAAATGSQSAETSTWPRTFVDAGGYEITLEQPPQRIVILHSNYLEYFFALGVPPVASAGASVGTAQQALETYETLKPFRNTADIMDIGSAREINPEAVLQANPDVIVTFAGHGGLDQIYEQLTQIAPVVLLDYNDTWQNQTRACAQILGQEEQAEKLIQESEAAIDSAFQKISSQEKTVAVFRTNGGQAFVGRGNEAYYKAFGLTAPAAYTYDYAAYSLEAVAEMNPDYIIFQDYITIAEGFVQSQEASSVWSNMDAVKNSRIIYFDDSLNTFGPLAMRLTAEKLMQVIQ